MPAVEAESRRRRILPIERQGMRIPEVASGDLCPREGRERCGQPGWYRGRFASRPLLWDGRLLIPSSKMTEAEVFE